MDKKPTYEELLQKVKELEENIFEKKRAEEEFETQQEMLFSALKTHQVRERMRSVIKENDNVLSPAFKGLSEKEIMILYNSATIKSVQSGDVLIKEGDSDPTVYIILEGEIRIVKELKGKVIKVDTLHPGNSVGRISLTRKTPHTASVVARTPSSLMAINIDRINTFEEKTQLYFYKVLHNLAGDRFRQLEAREKELIGRNRNLIEDIFSERTRDKADYQQLKMVRAIIKKVPRLPLFIHSLVSKIMDDRVSPNEIAEQVKGDPSLMGIVLKTVNSSYYGFQKKISDISHAIVLIGLNGMFQLITAEGARRSMPDTPRFHELHFHSVAVSHFAFELSQNLQLGKPSQIATIGMVHDLGQVVIQLLKEQNPNLAMLIDALNSAQMGSLLLKEWNLPDVVWRSVEFQRYPEFSPPDNVPHKIRNNVVILYLAHLCYGFFQNQTEDELSTTFLDEYKRLLNRETFSVANFALKSVLPGLIKKLDSLPISLRQLLKKYT